MTLSGGRRFQSSDRFDHSYQYGLRVAVHHVAVVGVEQLVLDAGISLALAALDDVDLPGFVGVEDRRRSCGCVSFRTATLTYIG